MIGRPLSHRRRPPEFWPSNYKLKNGALFTIDNYLNVVLCYKGLLMWIGNKFECIVTVIKDPNGANDKVSPITETKEKGIYWSFFLFK